MTEADLVARFHEDVRDLKKEIQGLRSDLHQSLIDIAVLKAKAGMIAVVSGLAASAFFQWVTKVFF